MGIDPTIASTRYIVRVRFRDTDLMGIVHHATYLEYLEAGRVEYLRRRGIDYGNVTTSGIHLAVAEVQVRYRKPLRFDERLMVETTLAELGRASARFTYRLMRVRNEDEVVAEASTLLACVDDNQRICRIPRELEDVLRGPELSPRPPDQT
jgi:acyl-CoA thioester hydrolase